MTQTSDEQEEQRVILYPYEVRMKIGKVPKVLRVHATDDEDARRRAMERFQILGVKRGDALVPEGATPVPND